MGQRSEATTIVIASTSGGPLMAKGALQFFIERDALLEQLFSSEITFFGAARYCLHLYKITGERNYNDALILIVDSLTDIDVQRRKLRESEASYAP
jgi:hypothetical protein